jgi:hypothetical protein
MNLIMPAFPMSSFNSWFFLILQIPFTCCVIDLINCYIFTTHKWMAPIKILVSAAKLCAQKRHTVTRT